MISLAYGLGGYTLLCFWAIYLRGPFKLEYNRVIAWYLKKLNVVSQCIGARGYTDRPLSEFTAAQIQELLDHEGDHYKLWRLLGPLFLPAYWLLLAIYGYDKHPWEQRARRAAHEPER